MRALVDAEAHLVAEAARALGARVGGGPRVGLLVLEQVLFLAKAPRALGAAEGPLARVVPLVACQVGLLAEALATLAARVRLLPGVGALVDLQRRPPAEPLPAVQAHEVTLAGRKSPACQLPGLLSGRGPPWTSSLLLSPQGPRLPHGLAWREAPMLLPEDVFFILLGKHGLWPQRLQQPLRLLLLDLHHQPISCRRQREKGWGESFTAPWAGGMEVPGVNE